MVNVFLAAVRSITVRLVHITMELTLVLSVRDYFL